MDEMWFNFYCFRCFEISSVFPSLYERITSLHSVLTSSSCRFIKVKKSVAPLFCLHFEIAFSNRNKLSKFIYFSIVKWNYWPICRWLPSSSILLAPRLTYNRKCYQHQPLDDGKNCSNNNSNGASIKINRFACGFQSGEHSQLAVSQVSPSAMLMNGQIWKYGFN